MSLTNCTQQEAMSYLQAAGGNVENAINMHYTGGAPAAPA